MGKYIGFIICLLISICLLTLSLIQDTFSCSRQDSLCHFKSKIKYINIELNNEDFSVSDLNNVYCKREVQPSKRGKQSYYILKLDTNKKTYNITTYKKFSQCSSDTKQIKDYIKDKSENFLLINSGTGYTNLFGIMFAIIIFITGIIILREPPSKHYDFDEETEKANQNA